MHFIAMVGFRVEETRIRYDVSMTVLSLAVAIAVVGVGVFAVGYRGATGATLLTAGIVTGLGVAAMHYMGMSALKLNGSVQYDPVTVALSVVIAVVAATAALWAAVSIRGFLPALGASLIMGVAVTGMHYTGMAAVDVHLHGSPDGSFTGDSPTSLLLPMLIGPFIFLVLAGVVVMFDPLLVLGDVDWSGRPTPRQRATADRAERPGPPPTAQWAAHSDSLFGPSANRVRHPRDRREAEAHIEEW
jgi:NO-binding membrane sensor protein with MHYT domain